MSSQIKLSLAFNCPKCHTAIDHNYTQKDIETLKYLDLKCQKCGYEEKLSCQTIIDKAVEEVKSQIYKALK